MSTYLDVVDHRSMVFDTARNRAYAYALETVIDPDSVVLDLGAGLGIHGLMAAARGARHVYLVDSSPVVTLAARVAAENGLDSRVTCIQKPIEQVDLPGRVDLIVSVLTGNFLLEEDLLPSLFFARDKFLKPSGLLLPDFGEMRIVPVTAERYYDRYLSRWSDPAEGIDFSNLRSHAANSLYFGRAKARTADFLSAPETIAALDFSVADRADCSGAADFVMERDERVTVSWAGSVCAWAIDGFRHHPMNLRCTGRRLSCRWIPCSR